MSNDFWKINIGHVATIAVFCVGLGIAYQELRGEQKLSEQKFTSEVQRLETKINLLDASQPQIAQLTRELAELRVEMKYLRLALEAKSPTRATSLFFELPDQQLIITPAIYAQHSSIQSFR
jgi:hypothetical protein